MKSGIPAITFGLILLAYVIAILHIEEIRCLAKHHTVWRVPYGYTLLTNGHKYKFRNDLTGMTNSDIYESKTKAIVSMWWDYDYEKKLADKMKENNPENWYPYE
jgi:hypothetical protein